MSGNDFFLKHNQGHPEFKKVIYEYSGETLTLVGYRHLGLFHILDYHFC